MAATKRYIVWQDAGGRTTATIPCASASLNNIMSALLALSSAAPIEWFEGLDHLTGIAPPGGTYPDVSDLARLTYSDTAGNLANLSLPAPSSTIFLADQRTVDPTAIAVLNSVVIGHLCTSVGSTVTSFVSGLRTSKPNPNAT